jgi:hypothetical protein
MFHRLSRPAGKPPQRGKALTAGGTYGENQLVVFSEKNNFKEIGYAHRICHLRHHARKYLKTHNHFSLKRRTTTFYLPLKTLKSPKRHLYKNCRKPKPFNFINAQRNRICIA